MKVYPDAPPSPRDGIVFEPLKAGVARVEMTDVDNAKEEVVVVVEKGTTEKQAVEAKTLPLVPDRIEAVVVVPEGNFVRLEIKTKKRIAEVVISKNPVIKAYTGSGRDFLFEALRPGVTNVVMTDIDGTKDKVVVVVDKNDSEEGAKK